MMPDSLILCFVVYIVAVNIFALVLTVYDKRAARRDARRVRERTLLLVAVAGGSVAMLAAMHVIRHKTKHLKFMAGIPIIITLQIAVAAFVLWQLNIGIL